MTALAFHERRRAPTRGGNVHSRVISSRRYSRIFATRHAHDATVVDRDRHKNTEPQHNLVYIGDNSGFVVALLHQIIICGDFSRGSIMKQARQSERARTRGKPDMSMLFTFSNLRDMTGARCTGARREARGRTGAGTGQGAARDCVMRGVQ